MMLSIQYHFRTHAGNDSAENHQYTIFLAEDCALSVGAYSEKGKKRATNQDNYLLKDVTLVVADGAGGHSVGEIASELVCDTFEAEQDVTAVPSPHQQLSAIVQQAHTHLLTEAERRPTEQGKEEGLCAAVVAVRFSGNALHAVHVGDSRLYRIRQGTIEQLTEDDSAAWDLYKAGNISKDKIRFSQNRNIIQHAVGFKDDDFASLRDKQHIIQLGDIYILCTDGLWVELSDEQIKAKVEEAYREYPDDDLAAAQTLVLAANAAGGRDNITAVVARVKATPLEALLERGIGSIMEVDDTSLLRDFVERYEARLRRAQQSKARFILAEYTRRTKPELPLVARDFYEEALERASLSEMREPYIGHTVSELLKLYSLIYVRQEGMPNGREQTFFSKVLNLQERVRGHKEAATVYLCDAVHRIAERVLEDYISAGDGLAGIHTLVDSHLSHIPELENAFLEMYNRLTEKAVEAKDYTTAHKFVKKIAASPREDDTYRTGLLKRQNALVVGIARGYYEQGNIAALLELAEKEHVPATFYAWGKTAFSARQFDAAAAAFSAATVQGPKNSLAFYYLGRSYHALSRTVDAQDAFLKAIALQPKLAGKESKEARKHYDAGEFLYALWAGERAHVLSHYTDALAPHLSILRDTMLLVGDSFIQKEEQTTKERAYAKRAYLTAGAIDPVNTSAVLHHCHALAKQYVDKKGTTIDEYKRAEVLLHVALDLGETNPWAHYRLGKCYRALGDHNAARDAFTSASSITENETLRSYALQALKDLHHI